MHENLWAGVGLKVELAGFFLRQTQAALDRPRGQRAAMLEAAGATVDIQWQPAFYANLDAFLVMARSVPEVINSCFGTSGLVDQRLRRGDLRRHVGEHPLHALELANWPPKLFAFLCVGERQVVGALCEPERDSRSANALPVIGVHQIGKPRRKPCGGNTSASAARTMSSKIISVSGMPRNPMAGSRLPMMSPGVSSRIAINPPIPSSSPFASKTRAKIR